VWRTPPRQASGRNADQTQVPLAAAARAASFTARSTYAAAAEQVDDRQQDHRAGERNQESGKTEVVAPFLGTGTINSNDFSLPGLLVSFAGAVILLAIVNLFRRGRVR